MTRLVSRRNSDDGDDQAGQTAGPPAGSRQKSGQEKAAKSRGRRPQRQPTLYKATAARKQLRPVWTALQYTALTYRLYLVSAEPGLYTTCSGNQGKNVQRRNKRQQRHKLCSTVGRRGPSCASRGSGAQFQTWGFFGLCQYFANFPRDCLGITSPKLLSVHVSPCQQILRKQQNVKHMGPRDWNYL